MSRVSPSMAANFCWDRPKDVRNSTNEAASLVRFTARATRLKFSHNILSTISTIVVERWYYSGMLTKRERFLLEIQQKKQEGVTQRELARLYDVHENTIANWLKGLSKPLAINVETKKGPHPDLATTPPMPSNETAEATAHSTASATPSATAMRTNT